MSKDRAELLDKLMIALLQILFIGLKLTGYISWSWWLVLLPLIIIIIGAVIIGLLGLLVFKLEKLRDIEVEDE